MDILGGATGLNYALDYRNVDGIIVPTKRRVYAYEGDYQLVKEPLLVKIDMGEITFSYAVTISPSGSLRRTRSRPGSRHAKERIVMSIIRSSLLCTWGHRDSEPDHHGASYQNARWGQQRANCA